MNEFLNYTLKNNYNFTKNKIFKNLFYSLYNKKEILIDSNILKKINYKINNKKKYITKQYQYFLQFLFENNIEHIEINYKDKKIKNFKRLRKYINKSSYKYFKDKTWLLLSKNNFILSLKLLNNKKSLKLYNYYKNLEIIFYKYLEENVINFLNIKYKKNNFY